MTWLKVPCDNYSLTKKNPTSLVGRNDFRPIFCVQFLRDTFHELNASFTIFCNNSKKSFRYLVLTIILLTIILLTIILFTIILLTIILFTIILLTIILFTIILLTIILFTIILLNSCLRRHSGIKLFLRTGNDCDLQSNVAGKLVQNH